MPSKLAGGGYQHSPSYYIFPPPAAAAKFEGGVKRLRDTIRLVDGEIDCILFLHSRGILLIQPRKNWQITEKSGMDF